MGQLILPVCLLATLAVTSVQRTGSAAVGNSRGLVCPSSYIKRPGGICLKLHKKTLSYPAAKASCARDGARLFTVRSQADNEWVVKVLKYWQRRTGKKRDVWIGLTDVDTEGTFVWEDGPAFDATGYSNWADDAHAVNNGFRDCVFLNKRLGWQWSIQKCKGKWERDAGPNSYICAKNAVP